MAPKRKAAKEAEMMNKRLAIAAGLGVETQDQEPHLEEKEERLATLRYPAAPDNMPKTDKSSQTVISEPQINELVSQLISPMDFDTGRLSTQPLTGLVPQFNNAAAAIFQSAIQEIPSLPGPLRQGNHRPLLRPIHDATWHERKTQQQRHRIGTAARAVNQTAPGVVTSQYQSPTTCAASPWTTSATDGSTANSHMKTYQTSKSFSASAQTADISINPGYGVPIPGILSIRQIPHSSNSGSDSQPLQQQQQLPPQSRFLPQPIFQAQLDNNTQEMARVRGIQPQQGILAQKSCLSDHETTTQLQQYQRYALNQPNRPLITSHFPPGNPGNSRNKPTLTSSTLRLSDNRLQDCLPARPRVNSSSSSSSDAYQPSTEHVTAGSNTINDGQKNSLSGGTANVSTSSVTRKFSLQQQPSSNLASIERAKMTANTLPSESAVTVVSADHSLLPTPQTRVAQNQPQTPATLPRARKSAQKANNRPDSLSAIVADRLQTSTRDESLDSSFPEVSDDEQNETEAFSSRPQEPREAQARLNFKKMPLTVHLDIVAVQQSQCQVTPGSYHNGLCHNLNHKFTSAWPELLDRVRAAGTDPSQFKRSQLQEMVPIFETIDPARLHIGYVPRASYLSPGCNGGRIALQPENHAMELDRDPQGGALPLLGARSHRLITQLERTSEQDEDMRLCDALAKTLRSYTSAKAQQDARKADIREAFRPAQYRQHFSHPLALEMMEQIGVEKRDQSLSIHGGQNRIKICSFCNYECTFGSLDSRVWLPVEASQGFCKECHSTTMSAVALWQTAYKLPPDMSTEAWARQNKLAIKLAEPPLKALSDELDFHAQASKEMGKEDRKNIIKHQLLGRALQTQKNSPKNLCQTTVPDYPAKTPSQRQSSSPNTASGGIRSASGPGPSPLSRPLILPPNLGMSPAMQTSWKGGKPSQSQSMMPGIKQFRKPDGSLMITTNDYIRKPDRVLTPNGIEIAKMMGFAAVPCPPNTATSGSSSARMSGMSSAILSIPPETSSESNAAGHLPSNRSNSNKTQQSQYPTVPSTPSRDSLAGIHSAQHEKSGNGLSGSSINSNTDFHGPAPRPVTLQQPALFRGPGFCRGSPWRQVDFTVAKICSGCFIIKSDVKNHLRHIRFVLLSEVPGGGALGHDKEALKIGRSATDQVVRDQRYGNCMICTNQAIYGCMGCPLRVCVQCQVHLTVMCMLLLHQNFTHPDFASALF
ncbi:hypothetical protein QTJ16_003436 [Diplocarpon rosae]|uniref:Uncharacterized protein n=1 Tax=Diplocarpon rosae TaxID=946125 RepID=A0AAD9T378_9HELO|nr:hypothetical protein QTJ16_003436 [Diplocarpon rosae]